MSLTRLKRWKHHLTATAFGAALLTTVVACDAVEEDNSEVDESARELLPEEIRNAGVIRVGATAQFPPFAYQDPESGELSGYEPALMDELADRLGIDVDYTTFEFQGLIPAIQSERIHVAASGLTDTAERQEVAIFVSNLIGRNGAIFPAEMENEYERFNDLCGLDVAVVTGSVSVTILEEQNSSCEEEGLEPMERLELADNAATLLAVDSGRADAALQTWPGAGYQVEQNPDFAAMVIEEGMNAEFVNGLAVDKDMPELADAFAEALSGMIEDGTYAELLEDNGVDVDVNGVPEVHLNWTTNGFDD